MATLNTLASQMAAAFEKRSRPDGSEFVALRDGSPQWMTDIMYKAHGDGDKLPDDTIYSFASDAVAALAEIEDGEPEDAINEIEPDIYTHELTAWLHARPDHVFYITEALENFGPFDDGFKLLATAQMIQREEVGHAVLNALRELETDEDEEAETEKENVMTETHWNTCHSCGTEWPMHDGHDVNCPNPECAGEFDLNDDENAISGSESVELA